MDININNCALSLKQRNDLISTFFMCCDIEIIECKPSPVKHFTLFKVEIDNQVYDIHILSRNISNSGWADKPYIKRIQVSTLKDVGVYPNKGNTISVMVGIGFTENETFICLWNPFRYTFHKTNRSCYVLCDTIENALSNGGLCESIDCNKQVIVCDKFNFKNALQLYVKKNGLD